MKILKALVMFLVMTLPQMASAAPTCDVDTAFREFLSWTSANSKLTVDASEWDNERLISESPAETVWSITVYLRNKKYGDSLAEFYVTLDQNCQLAKEPMMIIE